MQVALIIVAVILFIGSLIAYSIYADRKRRDELQEIAEELGLDFLPDGSEELFVQLGHFKLMNLGHSKRQSKLIRGESDEVQISIFDYQYTRGHGKNKRTHIQTVAALLSPRLSLTEFSMRPEGLLDSVGGMMGFQDIDFDSHPNFSKMFVLKGADEAAVRELFQPAILEFFETKNRVSVEGVAGGMIFYRTGRYVQTSKIKNLLSEAYEVYGAFADNA